MSRHVLLTACCLLSLAAGHACAQAPQEAPQQQTRAKSEKKPVVFRHPDVDTAWQAAQKSRRPVLVFVTSANCFYCKKMYAETLSHPQIAAANNKWFETAFVSNDKQPEIVEKLGIKAFPTTLVVKPDGSLYDAIRGFVEPQEFAERVYRSDKAARQANREPGRGEPAPRR